AKTWAFDSERDYDRLSAPVRRMLEAAIPTTERAEIAYMYSQYDRVALQTYRHWALPLKDYSDVARALSDGASPDELLEAQRTYVERLESIAAGCAAQGFSEGGIRAARREVQGALAAFAVESG